MTFVCPPNGIMTGIFKTNPDLKDLTDHFGRTPLIYCILADRVNTAKYLIKSGAQISSGWFSNNFQTFGSLN